MEWQGEDRNLLLSGYWWENQSWETDHGSDLPSVTKLKGGKAGSRTQASWAPVMWRATAVLATRAPSSEKHQLCVGRGLLTHTWVFWPLLGGAETYPWGQRGVQSSLSPRDRQERGVPIPSTLKCVLGRGTPPLTLPLTRLTTPSPVLKDDHHP